MENRMCSVGVDGIRKEDANVCQGDESLVFSVEEGGVDYMQDKDDILQREDRTHETNTEDEALQRGQKEGEKR